MKKNTTNSISTPNFTILGFFGIYFIVCAALLPLFMANFAITFAIAALILAMMGFGYILQSIVCKLTHFKRELESRAYESEYRYFKAGRAFPVWVIAFVSAFLVRFLADRYLWERAKQPTFSYDPDSLIPLTIAIFFVVAVALGSFVWFFPYNRLMTGSGLYTGLTILGIIFVLYSMMKAPGMAYVGMSFIGYAFCALISANQHAVGRTYRGTVVSFMTLQTRRYNLLLSFGLVAVFLLILFGAYLIVNGFRVIALSILAALFRAAGSTEAGYTEEEEKSIYESISMYIYGTKEPTDSPDYWYFILFVICSVFFIILYFTRHRPEIRKLIAWIKAKIVALFEFFWVPIKEFSWGGEEGFSNYTDEEIKLKKKDISAKRRAESKTRMTWLMFSTELRSKKNEEEKYRFAYSTFVDQLRQMPTFVKKSDTPRKIRDRLAASGRVTTKREIEQITEAFEQIEYADKPATPETEKALEALCNKIRENL